MNMPSHGGKAVHMMIIETNHNSIDDLYKDLNDLIFIKGVEYYKKGDLEKRGTIIINTQHIGKVDQYVQHDDVDYDHENVDFQDYRKKNFSYGKQSGIPRQRMRYE